MYPENLRYSSEHEWIRVEGGAPAKGGSGIVGITHFAQEALGDVVYVDLPEEGRVLKAGEAFGAVESVKSVSDLYAPVSGTVVAVNLELTGHPELVNQDPYGEGWMITMEIADPAELDRLLTAGAYQGMLKEG
ncbi:MAG TPA: glycine cleavage system protein GcvH [Spirochaetia bacterium]|nr:glycine cleavage system protein GcvH [Spirochaetia bacterium]